MKISGLLYQTLLCLFVLVSVAAVILTIGSTFAGWITKLVIILSVFLYARELKRYSNRVEIWYVVVMVIGFFFHFFMPSIKEPLWESLKWIVPVIFLVVSRKYTNLKLLTLLIITFFILESLLCVFERLIGDYVFTYTSMLGEESIFVSEGYTDTFRSHALLNHPLNNANVISAIMIFILCSNALKPQIQFMLVGLGALALWGCNERGSMVLWILILLFRFTLYDKKPIWIILILIMLFFVTPIVLAFISETGVLGRLDFDFSDDSVATRIFAFVWFAAHNWTFNNIVFGGDIIYMPGSLFTLENGVLLTLGYWGWIIGSLKTLLELVITYKCIYKYSLKDRILILMATWGVAFMNNNSFDTLFFTFLIPIIIVFNDLENRSLKRIINSNIS